MSEFHVRQINEMATNILICPKGKCDGCAGSANLILDNVNEINEETIKLEKQNKELREKLESAEKVMRYYGEKRNLGTTTKAITQEYWIETGEKARGWLFQHTGPIIKHK